MAIAWLPGPAGTRRRVAKPSVEEPDAAEPRPDLWGARVSNDPGLPDRSKAALQALTPPRERRVVGRTQVDLHYREQRVQEPFGLAEGEVVDKPQGQAVSMARSEYRRCPSRVPLRWGVQAAIASGANHNLTSPRRTRASG